jgi:hypothetical protein
MENLQEKLTESSIEQTNQKPKRKTKSKPTVETNIVKSEIETTVEETLNEKSRKKSFIVADYNKEYEWVLTEEIDNEAPLKFIFTLATNKEIANYNDNLMRIEGNGVVTYQNLVDIELLNLKLKRIENIELNGEVETVTDKTMINFIIDKVLDLDTINELSGYIRVMSIHKGKLI